MRVRGRTALLCAALAAFLLAGCSSSPSGAPSSPASTTPPSAPAPSSGDLSAGNALLLQKVRAWYDLVNHDFGAIQTDAEAITTAAAKSNVTAVRAGCAQLRVDTATASADPVAPEALLRTAVAAGLSAYRDGAAACLGGDLATTAERMNQGAAYLQRAAQIMASLG